MGTKEYTKVKVSGLHDLDLDVLDLETAIGFLPGGDYVHTFRRAGCTLMGAEWRRDDIISAMKAAPQIIITGDKAQSMQHGIAIVDEYGPLFIETIRWVH